MQYKVLALDLDGTLTNSEKIITPRTKAALREAAARGGSSTWRVKGSGRGAYGLERRARSEIGDPEGGARMNAPLTGRTAGAFIQGEHLPFT